MISNLHISILVIGALLGAPITVGAADSAPEIGDLLEYYRQNVHERESGVYELDGWYFFHQRVPMKGDAMFGQMKAMRSALANVNKDLFATLSKMEESVPVTADPALSGVKGLVKEFGTKKSRVNRSIESLHARVLCQDAENDDYVYDMAVRISDLKAEAGKGKFEERSSTIEQHWRNIVRAQLEGKVSMAFIRGCGAMDLWTLNSARCCGVKELIATNNTDESCCKRCITDLADSVSKANCDAATEYGRLLKDLYPDLTNELAGCSGFLTNRMVRLTLLSFGCCTMPEQKEKLSDLDLASTYAGQEEDVKATVEVFVRLVAKTPGSYMYWMSLGQSFARDGKLHLALSCFRNALRLRIGDGFALDALATTYDKLGCRNLARGAALLAFAMVDDKLVTERARRILSAD